MTGKAPFDEVVIAACVDQDRCVLCGHADCPFWVATLAGRDPLCDGTEDCASYYRGCTDLDTIADMCGLSERQGSAA